MRKHFLLILVFSLSLCANSQPIYFPASTHADSTSLSKSMPELARKLITAYKNSDRLVYFDNLFRLQILAGEYRQAIISLDSVLLLLRADINTAQQAAGIHYRAYALTMLKQPSPASFDKEYAAVLTQLYTALPEKAQPTAAYYFDADVSMLGQELAELLVKHGKDDSISIEDARELCRAYCSYSLYEKVPAPAEAALAAIEQKEFIIEDSVQIRTRDGAIISATVIRKKNIPEPLPAVLLFNIYAGPVDKLLSKRSAKYGYVGIVANTRGKRLSPEQTDPFEYDAQDAYDVIDWISKQPWCNGKVGMYGGSYLGFTQWASVKKVHPALKTIVPMVAVGIGIDYPMYNNVFMGYMLQWIHYVTNNKTTDPSDFGSSNWESLFKRWYAGGRSFRSLDTLDGRPNKIFQRWLQHPSHDSYWQNMVAYKEDFSNINIPVLTITGYYDDDQPGAMYYYKQHHLYNKKPDHYLLIGPYDHGGAQGTPATTINGYKIDSAALINITDITYQWFNHILKDSSRPAILKDKVNMQVMGANTWKHVPSLSQISNDTLTFYFSNIRAGNQYKLITRKQATNEFIRQEVNLQYRGDTLQPALSIIGDNLPIGEKLLFATEPFDKPVIITGSFTGEIIAALNKKDFDYAIRVYEQLPDGKFFDLSSVIGRASFAKDKSKRTLLKPGIAASIPLSGSMFTCRQLQKGSRLIVLLGVNKHFNWQVNYGSGKDVSDETMADGREPLQVQWFNSSTIRFPVLK
jgi:uncharacterized protein